MDVISIMDAAAEVELRAALYYHNFSQRYLTTPGGFCFWEKLSQDEKRHADTIKTFRQRRTLLPPSRRFHPEVSKSFETLRRYLLGKLEKQNDMGIAASLHEAKLVEEMMIHTHTSSISEVEDPLLSKLLALLGSEDRLHRDLIRQFSEAIGITLRAG